MYKMYKVEGMRDDGEVTVVQTFEDKESAIAFADYLLLGFLSVTINERMYW